MMSSDKDILIKDLLGKKRKSKKLETKKADVKLIRGSNIANTKARRKLSEGAAKIICLNNVFIDCSHLNISYYTYV